VNKLNSFINTHCSTIILSSKAHFIKLVIRTLTPYFYMIYVNVLYF